MTFHGMVNNAMTAKLPTIEESKVCCPQELLILKAMIMFDVIIDNVAVKMLTTSCIMHPPRLAGHGLHC